MMAKTHITFGQTVYLSVVGLLGPGLPSDFLVNTPDRVRPFLSGGPLENWSGAQPVPLLVSAIILSTMLIFPDLDHHNGTLAHKLGPFRVPVTKVISFLSGGHRKGMHSVFLAMSMAAIALFVSLADHLITVPINVIAIVLVFLCALITGSFLLPRSLVSKRDATKMSLWAAAFTALVMWQDPTVTDGFWLVVVMGLGPLLHDFGDSFTDGKVGWFWPFKKPFAIFPEWMRFGTDSPVESVILLFTMITMWACIASFIMIPLFTSA